MESTAKSGDRIRAWGYDFEWTREHNTSDELRPLMFSYDVLATECLDRFDELLPFLPLRSRNPSSVTPKDGQAVENPHPDFYGLLQQYASSDATIQRLLTEVNTVPPCVDWEQISRGRKVFYRYAGPFIISLSFHSLLGGMGSHRIAETLSRTGGFGVQVAHHRLLEAFQHILSATSSVSSLQPGGPGFASTLRVRSPPRKQHHRRPG